jgi:hypothetical protein
VEENANDDGMAVSLVWDMPGSPVVGVCFTFENTEDEVCGILEFDSLTGKQLLFDEFDFSGITNAQAYDYGMLRGSLERQMGATEEYVIGKDYDYCELLDKLLEGE